MLTAASWLVAGAVVTPLVGAQPVAAADAHPSAIGDEGVLWISTSPLFARTGTVVVMSQALGGCKQSCSHLWISRNGGASWSRAASTNWNGGRPIVAADGAGHETVYSSANSLQRSDNYGSSFSTLGQGGILTVSPTYPANQSLAVAASGNGKNYTVDAHSVHVVAGSGGTFLDQYFMLAPSFPSGGSYPPALLAAENNQTQAPLVLQCRADLTCSGAAILPGAAAMSAPATLFASTAYSSDGTVFALSAHGVYKSVDGGTSFRALSIGASGATTTATSMMALAPGYKEAGPVRTAYVSVLQAYVEATGGGGHTSGGVYRTTDGGASWSPMPNSAIFDEGATAVAVAPQGRLFAGYVNTSTGQGGLLCSDGGSWQASCTPIGGGSGQSQKSPSCSGSTCGSSSSTATAPPGGAAAAQATAAAGTDVNARPVSGGVATTRPGGLPAFAWALIAIAAGFAVVIAGLVTHQRRRRLD